MNETGRQAPVEDSATAGRSACRVILNAREERRVVRGHRWVFSNEIARVEGEPAGGDVVEVVRQDGRLVGIGHYNPHSLIAVRLLGDQRESVDRTFFLSRLRRALRLRQRLYPDLSSFRLVHGESDDLPGLVVDRYDDCLALQTLSLGMDRMKDTICDALEDLLKPRCIVERNESALREREGLPMRSGVLRGEAPERVGIVEADLRFEVRLMGGHKTGFYFDQRENRQAMRRFAPGARALDAYMNDGAFALHLARGGAQAVLGLDISEEAVEAARGNARLNGLEPLCEFRTGDAGLALEELHAGNERFDLIVLDPPSFTRSRKNVPSAKRG